MYLFSLLAKVTQCDCIYVWESEASKALGLESAKLLPEGLFVLWHWEWVEPSNEVTDEDISQEPDGTSDHEILSSGEESSTTDNTTADIEQVPKHTIAFKCIGASRDPESQEVLALAAKRKKEGQTIDVTLCPEPQNKYGAKAIAFAIEQDRE